jgi:hypothetical protein
MPPLLVQWEEGHCKYHTKVRLSSTFGPKLWEYIKRIVAIGCHNNMKCSIITNLNTKPPNMTPTGPFAPVFDYPKGVSCLLYAMYLWAYLIAELKNSNMHMLWLHAIHMLICLFQSCAVWHHEVMEEECVQQPKIKHISTRDTKETTSSNDKYPSTFLVPPAPALTCQLQPWTTSGLGTVALTGAKSS